MAQVTRGQFVRADLVVYHIHLHPGAGSFFQCLAQVDAYAVIADDEELQQNGVLRSANGLQQIAVGVVTIAQQLHFIAGAGGISGAMSQGLAELAGGGFPCPVLVEETLNALPKQADGCVPPDAGCSQNQIQGNG